MQQTQLTTFQTKILIGIFLFLLLTPIRSIAIMVSPHCLFMGSIVFITLKCNEEPDGYSLCGEALL